MTQEYLSIRQLPCPLNGLKKSNEPVLKGPLSVRDLLQPSSKAIPKPIISADEQILAFFPMEIERRIARQYPAIQRHLDLQRVMDMYYPRPVFMNPIGSQFTNCLLDPRENQRAGALCQIETLLA
jgi:hypothetical protein